MNIRTMMRSSVLLLSAALTMNVPAAVDQPYEVGTWGDFAKGAMSFTFDDNTPNQIGVGQPLFDQYGFHMTMFIVMDWGPNWENYKKAFEAGHEIGSHSISHPQTMPTSELKTSQDEIKSNVPGEMAVSVAYPNCNTPGDNEVLKYYVAGRNCNGQLNGKTPSNFAQIGSKICGNTGPNDAQALNGIADQAASQGGWGVYLFHGIDKEPQGSSDYSPVSSSALKGCLQYLDQNRSKVWVESFGNVARYIKERDAVSVTGKESSDDKIVISVTDNLDDKIYNYPLCIRRPLPDGWETAYAFQSDKEIEDSIVTDGSKKYIMFNAVPDGGDVTITKNIPTSVKEIKVGLSTKNISPVQYQNNTLLIDGSHFNNASVQVSLFDINGKRISKHEVQFTQSPISLTVSHAATSAMIAKVSGGGKTWNGMIVSNK